VSVKVDDLGWGGGRHEPDVQKNIFLARKNSFLVRKYLFFIAKYIAKTRVRFYCKANVRHSGLITDLHPDICGVGDG